MKNIAVVVVVFALAIGVYYAYQERDGFGGTMATSTATSTANGTSAELSDGTYTVDTARSTASWEGAKTLIATWIDRGTIKLSSGTATVTGGEITDTTVVFDMASIGVSETGRGADGVSRLTEHLKSVDFFNVTQYPTATFKASGLSLSADGSIETITGDLTVRGITKQVDIPVGVTTEGDSVVVSGNATIDRTEFDIKFGSSKFFQDLGDNVINDEFKLGFKVYLTKSQAE